MNGRHFTKANKAVILLLAGIFSWWLIFVQDDIINEGDSPKALYIHYNIILKLLYLIYLHVNVYILKSGRLCTVGHFFKQLKRGS